MMSAKRYSEEFKIEAVKQVTERGYKVADVCRRLGITSGSLYKWIKLPLRKQEQKKITKE